MDKRRAIRYLKRQAREGRLVAEGITYVFTTHHLDSLQMFREAVQVLDGELWNLREYHVTTNRTRRVFEARAFIPDHENPNLNAIL